MSDEFEMFMLRAPIRLHAKPRNIADVGTIALEYFKGPIANGELTSLVLLAFHGAEMRHWVLKGSPPAPIDDIVRALTAQVGCDALAFAYEAPIPRNVVADRAFNIAIEGAEGAFDVMIVLRGAFGAPDATFQIGQLGQMRPTRKWLGVPTDWALQMYRKGGGGFGGPTEGEA